MMMVMMMMMITVIIVIDIFLCPPNKNRSRSVMAMPGTGVKACVHLAFFVPFFFIHQSVGLFHYFLIHSFVYLLVSDLRGCSDEFTLDQFYHGNLLSFSSRIVL